MRTTMLFVPGTSPAMIQNAGVLEADAVIFDLEDSVSRDEKDAARILVRNALMSVDYGLCERTVRINSVDSPEWTEDIREVVKGAPSAIVVPKTENENTVISVEKLISENIGDPSSIEIIPLIESAKGVEFAFEILTSSARIKTVIFGAEDYAVDIGARRTKNGTEIAYARARIVNAAAAAGIDAVDTPFVDVEDLKGLEEDSLLARNMGFKGKALISPRHCSIVKRVFTPSSEELEYAMKIVAAIKDAQKLGKGVAIIEGKMIDAPILKGAYRILRLADIDGDLYE